MGADKVAYLREQCSKVIGGNLSGVQIHPVSRMVPHTPEDYVVRLPSAQSMELKETTGLAHWWHPGELQESPQQFLDPHLKMRESLARALLFLQATDRVTYQVGGRTVAVRRSTFTLTEAAEPKFVEEQREVVSFVSVFPFILPRDDSEKMAIVFRDSY